MSAIKTPTIYLTDWAASSRQMNVDYVKDEYLLDFTAYDTNTILDFLTAVEIYESEGYTRALATQFAMQDLEIEAREVW